MISQHHLLQRHVPINASSVYHTFRNNKQLTLSNIWQTNDGLSKKCVFVINK